MVTLISDGGTMTVGRRTANYTWGSFDVVLPDGTEQEEDDGRIVDGYIYRPDDRGHGRGEITFVRADARIDMNAAKSDLEDTLDGSSRRTEGNVFYSREISGLGLGKKIPGADYGIGDVVNVLVWGKRIALPVTAVKRVSNTSRGKYDAVQVGGQALSDPERQRKLNSDLDRQIASEKRQRLKEAGRIRQTAETADSNATAAKQTAEQAVLTTQQLIDREQSLAISLQENNALWTQWRAHRTYPVTPGVPISNEWLTAAIEGATLTIQLSGDRWVGRIQILATSTSGFPKLNNYLIAAGGNRTQVMTASDGYEWNNAIIFIQPFFGVVAREWVLLARGQGWEQSRSWDFPEDPSPQIAFLQSVEGNQAAFPCDVLANDKCQWWNPGEEEGTGQWEEAGIGAILPAGHWIRPKEPGENQIDPLVKFKELLV
ncbi:hypothetical protein [Corynebacterium callunae]|uniref:hypothetical protein n=1 Tax=Corynebacterium callunae TaxID=1721 RepID=UPI0020001206|nr:hypothetical protein [Corynebacterium callunae]MCK2199203.1 hypothetical protein [Corynebacterium callunae]